MFGKNFLIGSVYLIVCVSVCSAAGESNFITLFDGTSLDGWIEIGRSGSGYQVKNGKIVCPSDEGGNLFTEREFKDFIFRFEFKLQQGSNNGLAVRSPLQDKDIAYDGMELQIIDNRASRYKDIKPWQRHGSLYHVFAAKTGYLLSTGQWNQQEVFMKGSRLKITLNTAVILDVDLDKIRNTTILKRHPGLKRKSGHIGFLGHKEPVEFRNIRLRPL